MYIYQYPQWPQFTWQAEKLTNLLADIRYRQGRLLGSMEAFGFSIREEAVLETLTLDVVKSSEIEGELLDEDQVRSSIAQQLGMDSACVEITDRHVEGIVTMMLNATQQHQLPLTQERLLEWHRLLFPNNKSGCKKSQPAPGAQAKKVLCG